MTNGTSSDGAARDMLAEGGLRVLRDGDDAARAHALIFLTSKWHPAIDAELPRLASAPWVAHDNPPYPDTTLGKALARALATGVARRDPAARAVMEVRLGVGAPGPGAMNRLRGRR